MGAMTFLVAFSIPILAVLGIAIWQLSWWPILIFFGILFGAGFLRRLVMSNPPSSRR